MPADLIRQLGEGKPLPPQTRSFFEQRLGHDLSHVRIHADARAEAAATRIQARAFTFGHHIAFAAGQYQPEGETGKRLLAHELTHVLQQHDDRVPRMIMRQGGGSGGASSGSDTFEVTHADLEVPPIKARHLPQYSGRAGHSQLRRRGAYDASTRNTAQISRWLEGVTASLDRIPAAQRPSAGAGFTLNLNLAGGATVKPITAGSEAELTRKLKIPTWDSAGNEVEYQVDHMVEYQLGGEDDISNMELLNQTHNGSVGSSFSHGIKRAVREEIDADPAKPALAGYSGPKTASGQPTPEGVMEAKTVVFKRVQGRARESRRREGGSSFWTREQINNLDHVLPMLGGGGGLEGDAQNFALLSPTGNLLIARFHHPNGQNVINVPANQQGGMAGFSLRRITLNGAYNDAAASDQIGDAAGRLDLGPRVTVPPADVSLPILQAQHPGKHSGKIGTTVTNLPSPVEFTGMSPLDLSDLTFGRGVFGRAVLHPTHPALSGINIPGEIRNGRLGIYYSVDATALASRLNIPGLTIDSASIDFGYDGTDFSIGGGAEFTIRNFGTGFLNASLDTGGHFQLEGGFRADTRLFDQASMRLWYRSEGGFGGDGTLAITNPNKIRGIRSASVHARYENGVFSADGTVEPSLPGVQRAGLQVRYGPDASGATSLLIGGDLQLASGVPGIREGSVHAEVEQSGDAWHVRASGHATPNLPGVTSSVEITYNDGLFDGHVDVAYTHGIFSGNVTVGVTNRPVTPEGELAGGAASSGGAGGGTGSSSGGTAAGGGTGEDTLKVYGSGNVTARLTDHLQGGVGLKIKPNGTLLLSGRIGIPDSVELFGQYPAAPNDQRELFHMPTVSIPLLGIAVGGNTVGIALTISGRVVGYARVGPGRLTQAELNVIDFNPAQPDSLHITGGATFDLPGAAGVEASLDAGVSLGAAVIRATAGLSASAAAGVEAHVTPHVDLDYAPRTGLHVHADLNASLSPRLRFGLNGYAEVVADAFVTSFTLWRKNWNLAQREIGSSLSLGLNVPVDYYSDGRGVVFDPNRVTFQVPSLNRETFEQLLNNQGGSEHVERRRPG